MQRIYRSASYAESEGDYPSPLLTMDVITSDAPQPRWTGLYNTDGREIMAVDTRDPIGFVWFK